GPRGAGAGGGAPGVAAAGQGVAGGRRLRRGVCGAGVADRGGGGEPAGVRGGGGGAELLLRAPRPAGLCAAAAARAVHRQRLGRGFDQAVGQPAAEADRGAVARDRGGGLRRVRRLGGWPRVERVLGHPRRLTAKLLRQTQHFSGFFWDDALTGARRYNLPRPTAART